MDRKRIVLVTAIIVLFLISVAACANSSEAETEADGTLCYLPRPRDSVSDFLKVAGHNEYMTASDVGDWTGTFTGTSDDYAMEILHSSGRMIFVSTDVFDTVDVDGTTGGLEMFFSGERPDRVSDWKGRWVITSGTGALEDLQGHGTWWGLGWQGNYSDCGVLYYSVEELDYKSD